MATDPARAPGWTSRRVRCSAVAGAALVVLAGCGSAPLELSDRRESAPREDAAPPERAAISSPPRDLAAMCAAARRIRDLDGRSSQVMSQVFSLAVGGEPERADEAFTAAIGELQALLPDLDRAYASLRDSVPGELADDVETLRAFTTELMSRLSEAASLEGFAATAGSISADDVAAVAQATTDLHAAVRDGCDIDLTG